MRMYPGRWDTAAAGHVDAGEDADQAAYRELAEETGINKVTLARVATYYYNLFIPEYNVVFKSYNHVYKGVYNTDIKELIFAKDEVAELKWLGREKIEQLITKHPDMCTDGITNPEKYR